jgi:hypothetical protein
MLIRFRYLSASVPHIVVEAGAFERLARKCYPTQLTSAPPPATKPASSRQGQAHALTSTSSEDPVPLSGVGRDVREFAAASGIAGVLTTVDWLSVDSHVFDAVGQMSGQQVDGFWDLSAVVDERHYQIAQDAFQRSLAGHAAEFRVADHLRDSGVHVVMPQASNAPGLDLWANGHALNVKNVQNVAATAHQHFAHYPDIGMVVPADVAAPHGALHFTPGDHVDLGALSDHHQILVDSALSHADTVAQVHHASNLLMQHGVPDHMFPIGTIAISGIREYKLL